MRKMLVLAITALALGVVLAGCSKLDGTSEVSSQTASVRKIADKDVQESNVSEPESSFLAGEESSSSDVSEQAGESAGSTVPQSEAESRAAADRLAERATQKQDAADEQPTRKPPAQSPTSATQPVIPPTTAPTPKPTPESTPELPPVPTPEPTPEHEPKPPTPAFDISPYVGYAQSYGQSVGLTLDNTATACWDNPINANAGCKYLERDIRDLLDWYAADGHTAFWVWAENLGGGEYLIYIGYA